MSILISHVRLPLELFCTKTVCERVCLYFKLKLSLARRVVRICAFWRLDFGPQGPKSRLASRLGNKKEFDFLLDSANGYIAIYSQHIDGSLCSCLLLRAHTLH